METSEAKVASKELAVPAASRAHARGWSVAIPVLTVTLLGIVFLYFDTFHSIVALWWRSETYAHGFMIVPISLYLIWDARDRLRRLSPRADFRALAGLLCLGIGWLVCHLGGFLFWSNTSR